MTLPDGSLPFEGDPFIDEHGIDIGRIFDAVQAIDDPALVPGVVMNGYHLQQLRGRSLEEELEVTAYDTDWEALRAAGYAEPVEDDPRRQEVDERDLPVFTYLNARALFTTRADRLRIAAEYKEITMVELADAILQAHDRVSEQAGPDTANFLLGLVGGVISEDRRVELQDIAPERLARARAATVALSPSFRDRVRLNIETIRLVDPELAAMVEGTPMEDDRMAQFREQIERWFRS